MDLDALVKKRKSVRSFKDKKVSWKLVLEAIDAALQGPFAGNHDNLHYLIVEDKKMIEKVAGLCEQEWIQEAPILVVVLSDDSNLENIYGERGRIYSRQQAGAAIQTIMLKLTELGLGSCWIGAYSDEMVKHELEIPSNIQIEGMIPIGYSNDTSKKKTKKELEHVLYWEKWKSSRRPTIFEEDKQDYKPQRYD
jgi:nitroreductase